MVWQTPTCGIDVPKQRSKGDPLTEPHSTEPAIDPLLATALDTLLPGHEGEQPVGGRPFLVRLPYAGIDIRARRWPAGTVPERVAFVHRLQSVLAAAAPGLAATPFAAPGKPPFLPLDGAVVDVQTWLPGRPASGRFNPALVDGQTLHRPHAVDADDRRRTIAGVAELHARTQTLARDKTVPIASAGQIVRVVEHGWRDARSRLRPAARDFPPIQRWLRGSEQVLAAAEDALTAGQLGERPLVVAHLDLWPAHVLLDEDRIRLLDFGAAVATTPLLDLAQLVTRFDGWTGERAESAIADYTDVRPLSPDERRLLPAVAALDLVIEAGRLLRLGYVDELPLGSNATSAARQGAIDMLNSLEAVTPAVVRAANPVPFAKRRRLERIAAQGNRPSDRGRQPAANRGQRREGSGGRPPRSGQRVDQRSGNREDQE